MKSTRAMFLFVVLALVTRDAVVADDLESRVDRIVGDVMQRGSVPGVSIAIARGDKTLLAKGYGFADLEHEAPATADTVYKIGSVTKQFTAAAILKLRDRGKLALDAPIARYLPDFKAGRDKVTIRHLLTHTSGIQSYTNLGRRWRDTVTLDLGHDRMVSLFESLPLDFAPGAKFAYSNSGYYLLGMIIERVSGESYADHMRRAVFTPLGLSRTSYASHEAIVKGRARGYAMRDGERVRANFISMSHPFSAGALSSTVLDLIRWNRALANGRALAPASYTEMTTRARLGDGTRVPYGCGIAIRERHGRIVHVHGGMIFGFRSELSHYTKDDLSIAVLSNGENAAVDEIGERVARVALAMDTASAILDLEMSDDLRAKFVGTYAVDSVKVRVFDRQEKLYGEIPKGPTERLLYQGQNRFVPNGNRSVVITFSMLGDRAHGVSVDVGGVVLVGRRIDDSP